MNQGDIAAYRHDDGVWQDGGLILHFPPAGAPRGLAGGVLTLRSRCGAQRGTRRGRLVRPSHSRRDHSVG
jgi:uncharacterized protein YukJ